MSHRPKHREVSRELLAEIAAGKYDREGRLPSEAQLVQRFKVSRPTIARALRDLQEEGLIDRRAGSGTFLRDQPAGSNPTRPLALLVPTRNTVEIFELICGELASLARAQDYTLLWGGSATPQPDQDLTTEHALRLCDQFIEQRVRGVFFAPYERIIDHAAVNDHIVQRVSQAGIPLILLDRDLMPFPHRSQFDLVGVDNLAGGWLLAEHLIKLGCRRLAFVARPHSAPTITARIAGVRESLAAHRLEIPGDWIHTGDPEDAKFVSSLIGGKRWDGVVCGNDLTATQLLGSLAKNSVRVPRDLRVVGFDDAKSAASPTVSLTTIRQPYRDIALTAFRAMLERLAEPAVPARSLLLTPQLVVRESCGGYLPRHAK